ncbi:hypothetical protein M2137_000206 [Parabacteroides sp. PFB2-10]|uniref:LamG-like jellyroll fold domain-containing protein n=1 Tax=Parabacteroides sp. PFB2-10 TaxID=1742405 RepID=UPI00247359C5|nr:LamG-like jellyroll fold domain-containing protein [Parabacteroides sp. PFB2-10]MDH6311456.1 hypothetical protein [Parabacteroides sp. PFB2-10]
MKTLYPNLKKTKGAWLSSAIRHFLKEEKRKSRNAAKTVCLILLLLLTGQAVKAQTSFYVPYNVVHGTFWNENCNLSDLKPWISHHDMGKGFIDIFIPYYHNKGNTPDHRLESGTLYFTSSKAAGNYPICTMYAEDKDHEVDGKGGQRWWYPQGHDDYEKVYAMDVTGRYAYPLNPNTEGRIYNYEASITGNGPRQITFGVIRWYYSRNRMNDVCGIYVTMKTSDSKETRTYPLGNLTFPTIPTPTFECTLDPERPGYTKVVYNYPQNPIVGNTSFLVNYANETPMGNGNPFYIPCDTVADQIFSVSFRPSEPYAWAPAPDGSYWESFKIPAQIYHHPEEFTLEYDREKSIVNVSWSLASTPVSAGRDYIKGDQFEIERAEDESFESSTQVGLIDFNETVDKYSLQDTIGQFPQTGEYYYRIRRTHTADIWQWRYAQERTLTLATNHTSIVSAAATLGDDGKSILVTWKEEPGIWSKGSKLILRKMTRSGTTDIELTQRQFLKGEYLDEMVQMCNDYSYDVFIAPGNSSYAQEIPIRTETVTPYEVGTISDLVVSKGYFPDRVTLQWKAEGVFDNYVIKRVRYGGGEEVQLDAKIGDVADGLYLYEDKTGSAGVYYNYKVYGITNCSGNIYTSKDTLVSIGFRSPTGSIYGQVSFENGQAVPGVDILLTSEYLSLGTSIYSDGREGSYLHVPRMNNSIFNTDFSFQAWIRPDDAEPKNQILFDNGERYTIGFNEAGELFFKVGDNTLSHAFDFSEKTDIFTHFTFVHNSGRVLLFEKDSLLATVTDVAIPNTIPPDFYLLADKNKGRRFKGNIEEVRMWKVALDSAQIARDYTRLLEGDERGLLAYYRFDEAITDAFYDISFHDGDSYHANHGVIYGARHSERIPTSAQLALKGVTNEQGSYMVNGIPYTGNGTTYTITPRLKTHTFKPTYETRKISSDQNSFNVHFEDTYSFSVSGYVYYSNTDIPVQDVMFYIDGNPANDGKGNLLKSKSDGYFNIRVPAGEHEVKAVKTNHVFEKEGKITNIDGTDVLYDRDIILQEAIYDSTRVRVVGRVAGGPVQEAYPLGHSLSTNNLGEVIKIEMKYINDQKRLVLGKDSTIVNTHPVGKLDQEAGKEPKKTEVSFGASMITINPDKETGEFMVDLIPEKFSIRNTSVTGHGSLHENAIEMDLTNAFFEEYSLREYADSLELTPDTVRYNYAHQIIKRVDPIIEIIETKHKQALDHFGESRIQVNMEGNSYQDVAVYDEGYLFGFPVYVKAVTYHLQASVFEQYDYYNINEVKQREDRVPSQDGILKFTNNLTEKGAPTEAANQVKIDSTGIAYYSFMAGNPDLGSGIKTLQASVSIGSKEIPWEDGKGISAIIIGGVANGTRFVTKGPDIIDFVLRDPPGSNSYAYLEKGYTTAKTTSYKTHAEEQIQIGGYKNLGVKTITWTGVGGGGAVSTEVILENTISGYENFTFEGDFSTTETTTYTTLIQTSAESDFVGADGDLYIGKSVNINYGSSENITIVPDSIYQKYSAEYTLLMSSNDNKYRLVNTKGVALGQTYATNFIYPQVFLEEVMIPELERVKRSLLRNDFSNATEAAQYAIANRVQVYHSLVNSDHENYGEDAYYLFLSHDRDNGIDSVKMYNESIRLWKKAMADNEKDKIEALKKSKNVTNYSIHAGSQLEFNKVFEYVDKNTYSYSITLGTEMAFATGFQFGGSGYVAKIDIAANVAQTFGDETAEANSTKTGFVLAESESSDYISVDVAEVNNRKELEAIWEERYRSSYGSGSDADKIKEEFVQEKLASSIGGYVFALKGGATSCPYEPQYITKYHEPGTAIGQSTARIEVPKMSMPVSLITDVPETRKAVFTLELKNESETENDGWYVLRLVEESNPHGAQLFIDGTPLGNGRAFFVKSRETLTKTLEVGKGAVNEYENLVLSWESQCDSKNNDRATFSVHFVTSCSYVEINSPRNNWVVNTESPTETIDGTDRYYLPITIDQYDVNFENFHHIEFQYKLSSESDKEWTTVMEFFPDSASYKEAVSSGSNSEKYVFSGGSISGKFVVDGLVDQRYDLAAVSVCRRGNQYIPTVSAIHSGIKDTRRPSLFGSIQPADGVLDPNDEVKLTFNEEIIEGYINPTNYSVKGIQSGTTLGHDVSIEFDGINDYLYTEATRNLTGKDLTIEMWIYRDGTQNGTLFSHGDQNNSFEISLLASEKLEVRIGNQTYLSQSDLKKETGMWEHIAVTYQAATGNLDVYHNWTNVINTQASEAYAGMGIFEVGRSMKQGGNYFKGKMHELRIWDRVFNDTRLQTNAHISFSGAESGLLAYYPMDEGKGKLALEKVRGANAFVEAAWNTPAGKSIALDGTNYVTINTGAAIITPEMDYTIEFWFKGEPGQQNAALVSNGRGDSGDWDDDPNNLQPSDRLFFLGFENGVLTFKNKRRPFTVNNKNLLDNNWHHLAVSVKRIAGRAQIYIDGVLATYFDATELGSIDDASMVLGARRYRSIGGEVVDMHFKGQIDEFRLWSLYKDEKLVDYNNNVMMDGTEIGLLAYYPFEKLVLGQVGYENHFTLEDRKVNSSAGEAQATGNVSSIESAPIKPLRNELKLDFLTVVNKDALILYPNPATTRWEDFERTTLTFSLDNLAIRDLNGNKMNSPISWTVFVNRSQLHWTEKELVFVINEFEPLEFTARIANSSGSVERYTIENLPTWMKAKPSEGTIDPKTEQPITFTIAQGLNVGTYDEVIYLRSENNVTTPLPVTIRVMGEKPDWSVDPADFKYNMALYGKMRFNNIFSSDKDDMLAAFIDGECVGVANSVYLDELDMWYAFISIYSNEVQHEAVEFRMWDASTGQIYLGVPDTPIAFRNDKIYGSPRTPVIIDGENMLYQNITLNRGWNWISFNVQSESMANVNNLLTRKGWTSSDLVKQEEIGFDIFTQNEGWIGDISDNGGFTNMTMYNLKTEKTRTISLLGSPVDVTKTPITIRGNRWNYISYLPTVNMSVNEALADYDARENDIVKSQNSFAMYAGNIGWIGSLSYMESGKGYMLYREHSSDHSFRYPRNAGSLSQLRSATDEEYRYADNMTVVARIVGGAEAMPGDKLVAFIDGNDRSRSAVLDDDLFFLTIPGDESSPIFFALERNGKVIARTYSPLFDYGKDRSIGTIREPLALSFATDQQATLYPNPFEDQLNIVLRIDEPSDVEMAIYNLTGQKVHAWPKQAFSPGEHHLVWLADNQVSGMFIVRITINNQPATYKVIKK